MIALWLILSFGALALASGVCLWRSRGNDEAALILFCISAVVVLTTVGVSNVTVK